jgi:hypothetical protein
MAEMLKTFEPIAFPIESAAPPEKAADKATVNSGRVVETEINVNPTDVFPSRVMAAIFVAYLMTVSLVRFSTTIATAMITIFMRKSMLNKSAKRLFSLKF